MTDPDVTGKKKKTDPDVTGKKKKIVRLKDMPAETGLSERSVWDQVAEGTLPAPVQLGPRAVGWLADELEAWRERKRLERDERLATGGLKSVATVGTPAPRPRGRPRKQPSETVNALG